MEETKKLRMVNTREAIETVRSFCAGIAGFSEDLAVKLASVGMVAEMFLDLAPHFMLLRGLCEAMKEQIIKVHGEGCQDRQFAELKAALAALEAVAMPALCVCGKCVARPENERMPAGTVSH